MVRCLAVIPARGGSKRIPRKNIKLFLGEPIIQYSITAAIQSGCFEEVMVSTEDIEIAEVSKNMGAKIPFLRSAETASDEATTAQVLVEVLCEYEKRGQKFDYLCCLYPTAPFITTNNLKEGCEKIITTGADAALSIVKYSYPIQRSLQIINGRVSMVWPENLNIRSQDLLSRYHDAGQYYWVKVSSFLEQKKLFMNFTIPIEIPESQVQDIDNEEDWKLAEMKFSILYPEKSLWF